jgi:SAM-dependent methyltransferase
MNSKQYWEQVYATKASNAVSWFQQRADRSLFLIRGTGVGKDSSIIDAGGGSSTLIDDLVTEGYSNLTVLDLSANALEVAKQRLRGRYDSVKWLEGDVTNVDLPPQHFDVWHDRAVFHFLTQLEDRRAYVQQVMHALRPEGHVILSTFAEDGPEKCSGLPVMRYSPDSLQAEFGNAFKLLSYEHEVHHTPFGTEQQFLYCHFRLGDT